MERSGEHRCPIVQKDKVVGRQGFGRLRFVIENCPSLAQTVGGSLAHFPFLEKPNAINKQTHTHPPAESFTEDNA